jgi:hypothetical protein
MPLKQIVPKPLQLYIQCIKLQSHLGRQDLIHRCKIFDACTPSLPHELGNEVESLGIVLLTRAQAQLTALMASVGQRCQRCSANIYWK